MRRLKKENITMLYGNHTIQNRQGSDKMFYTFTVLVFEWLWCLSNLLIKPKMLSYDKGFHRDEKCKRFDVKRYQSWKKNEFKIKSDFGYVLFCELIEPDDSLQMEKENKIAILCHGLGCARYSSIKYVELFLKLGFTVLLYDHRNHGMSGKAYTTMGYYEKFDLKKIVDWCYDNYGTECKIITHGESMGAATVLMHLEVDRRVNLVIADCAYSDLKLLIRHQLKQYYHLPCFLIPIESCFIYFRAGFWLEQVSPINIVIGNDTPVLFIHGKRDNLVPAFMSKQMYDGKRKNKGIYLVAKARHAESYCVNKQGYEKTVGDFIYKFMK